MHILPSFFCLVRFWFWKKEEIVIVMKMKFQSTFKKSLCTWWITAVGIPGDRVNSRWKKGNFKYNMFPCYVLQCRNIIIKIFLKSICHKFRVVWYINWKNWYPGLINFRTKKPKRIGSLSWSSVEWIKMRQKYFIFHVSCETFFYSLTPVRKGNHQHLFFPSPAASSTTTS